MTENETAETNAEKKQCFLCKCPVCNALTGNVAKRILARLTDYILWGMFSILCLNLLLMHVPVPDMPLDFVLWGFLYIMFLLYIPVEAVLIARFQKTIGKALLGISVTNENNERLSFKTSFIRSFFVFMYGLAFFLPVVSILVPLYQLLRYRKKGSFIWDEKTQTNVQTQKNHIVAKIVLLAFYAFIIWGFVSVYRLQKQMSELPDPKVYIMTYLDEIQPYLAMADGSPLQDGNIEKTLEGLQNAQRITEEYQTAFLAMEDAFNKKMETLSDDTAKEMLIASFNERKEQIMGFLFLQQMRINLFENVADFFKRTKGQYTFKNGSPVFNTPELTAEYEEHMEQLSSFFESIGMFSATANEAELPLQEEAQIVVEEIENNPENKQEKADNETKSKEPSVSKEKPVENK